MAPSFSKLSDMTSENWLPIVGYEGLYEVSDHGRIRSVERRVNHRYGTRRVRARILLTRIDRDGYVQATLSKDNVPKTVKVHREVLAAFVGPCPEGMETLHGNDVPTDNRLENLRWGTSKQNTAVLIERGRHISIANRDTRKTHCLRGHPLDEAPVDRRGWRQCRECKRIRNRRTA